MTPLISALPAPVSTAAEVAVRPVPMGSETSSAPPPILGAQAVTQVQQIKQATPQRSSRDKPGLAEIPPDPPPLKGLGIPGLHTAMVGDFDKIETPPPSTDAVSASFAEVMNPPAHAVDVKR